MKIRTEIEKLNSAIGSMAAELKNQQASLMSFARSLDALSCGPATVPPRVQPGGGCDSAARCGELAAANSALVGRVAELEESNRRTTRLAAMNDFLQSAATEAEAWSIIGDTAKQLFPDHSGALFITCASRNLLEAAVVWGANPPARLIFAPAECWAERRARPHLATGLAQRCAHVCVDGHNYVCQPVLAQGATLGILHLHDDAPAAAEASAARMPGSARLAQQFADSIGVAIANLRSRETLRNLSIRDPLTGLFNRRYMEEALAQEQYRARRNDARLAVMMVDIDHFKRFNDQFGHDCGDAVLRVLGSYLKEQVRGSDIACRIGGEEFILILSPATTEGARLRAEAIRAGAAQLVVTHAQRALGSISLSLGVAMFPEHGADTAALVKAADVALYQAKRDGRDRVVMAPDPVSQDTGAAPLRPVPEAG